jgi:hypothetical protein
MKNDAKQLCASLGLTARPTATISFTRHFQYCSALGTLPLNVRRKRGRFYLISIINIEKIEP